LARRVLDPELQHGFVVVATLFQLRPQCGRQIRGRTTRRTA